MNCTKEKIERFWKREREDNIVLRDLKDIGKKEIMETIVNYAILRLEATREITCK